MCALPDPAFCGCAPEPCFPGSWLAGHPRQAEAAAWQPGGAAAGQCPGAAPGTAATRAGQVGPHMPGG